jgi:hypothetical protein
MPVILALALTMTAAVLGFRISDTVQRVLDQVERLLQNDQERFESGERLQTAMVLLSRSHRASLEQLRLLGWNVAGSGVFFNPLLWLGWSEEQRDRFLKGLKGRSYSFIWINALEKLKNCLPESLTEREKAFEMCTQEGLPEGMAFFPEPTPLNVNNAPLSYLQLMLPEATPNVWSKFANERARYPVISMTDFADRYSELRAVSPLPSSLDVKDAYIWLNWKGQLWLMNHQRQDGVSEMVYFRPKN